MTVRELLSRMDSYELAEWMAVYELDIEDAEKARMKQQAHDKVQRRRSPD